MGKRGDCGVVVVPGAAVLIESEEAESGRACRNLNPAAENN